MRPSPSSAVVPLLVGIAILLWFVIHAIGQLAEHPKPGPEWTHDRGSIYWLCTDSGRALIRDTDTGSTFLDRDDRKCDSGG